MTDKLHEEAERLARQLRNQCSVVPTRPLDALEKIFQRQIHSALQKARNDALKEAAMLMQDIVFVSGLSKDEAHNSIERANAIRELKVKP